MNKENITLTTPSGIEVEIISQVKLFHKLQNIPSWAQPMPHDINNQTYHMLFDESLYDSLSEEDKHFIYNSFYKKNELS